MSRSVKSVKMNTFHVITKSWALCFSQGGRMSYPAFTRAIHVNSQLYAYAIIYVVYNSGPFFLNRWCVSGVNFTKGFSHRLKTEGIFVWSEANFTTLISAKGCTLLWRYNNGNFYAMALTLKHIIHRVREELVTWETAVTGRGGGMGWGGVGWRLL